MQTQAEMREMVQTRDDELESVYAARDRLRALVARMQETVAELRPAVFGCHVPEWQDRLDALLADPDGIAASEWHEVAVRAFHVEESEVCLMAVGIDPNTETP